MLRLENLEREYYLLNKVKIRTTGLNDGDPNKFERIYISYYSLKQGWKLGKIELDACPLWPRNVNENEHGQHINVEAEDVGTGDATQQEGWRHLKKL